MRDIIDGSRERGLFELITKRRFAEAADAAEPLVRAEATVGPAGLAWIIALTQVGPATVARSAARRIAARPSADATLDDALGTALFKLRLHVSARDLFRRASEARPGDPAILFNLATAERALGRLAEAEELLDRVIALRSDDYAAYPLRSELRTQTAQHNHIPELLQLFDRAQAASAKVHLAFALGKELDDVGEYTEALHWYNVGAAAKRENMRYDAGRDAAKLDRIAAVYSSIASPIGGGDQRGSGRFAFILGLPRGGTTLVERLLQGHKGVWSNEETDNFVHALLANTPVGDHHRGTDIFERSAQADFTEVGVHYARLAETDDDAALIIEKMPMNYLYAGPIRRALPFAPIIWVKRSPADHCLAMYRTLFGSAYPFSYEFGELARYYAAFSRLMAHWRAVLPEPMLETSYDALVETPESVGAALAQHCGLEWQASAINVSALAVGSATASAAQVRQPIYRSSVGRWRRYGPALAPLIDALHANGVALED